MNKLILILFVALYSRISYAKKSAEDPSDPCQYKCFNCRKLDGNVFDVLRTDPDEAWKRYKAAYNLSYTDPNEDEMRQDLFEECLERVQRRVRRCNAGRSKNTHNFGLSPFCVLTPEERKARYGTKLTQTKILDGSQGKRRKRSYSSSASCKPANATLPASYDARNLSLVTPVKNQKQCGSCWTFAPTASVEHLYRKLTGQTKDLSEQRLVNCAQNSNGCNGGDPGNALNYIQTYGSPPETTFPYTATYNSSTCSKCPIANEVKIQDWCAWGVTWYYINGVWVKENVTTSLIMQTIYKYGSAVVLLDATNLAQGSTYTGGVYSYSGCTTIVNHAVLAVGWGTDTSGTPYWIVKNSWGTSWGEKGYFRIKKGVNMCGIEGYAAWPIINNTTLYTKPC